MELHTQEHILSKPPIPPLLERLKGSQGGKPSEQESTAAVISAGREGFVPRALSGPPLSEENVIQETPNPNQ